MFKNVQKKRSWRRGQPCFWDWRKSSEISRKKMRSSTTKVTSQPMTEVKSAAESYGGVRLVMMTWGYQN
jgi:hypothetical protein